MTTINGGSVSTSGPNADGVQADTGGVVTLIGGSVSTTGLEAFGVGALGGGNVSLSGTMVSTTGDASKGLAVFGIWPPLTASDLTVKTSGTINSADGDHAYAVFNGSGAGYTAGGTANLTEPDDANIRRVLRRRRHDEQRIDDYQRRLDRDDRRERVRRPGHERRHDQARRHDLDDQRRRRRRASKSLALVRC